MTDRTRLAEEAKRLMIDFAEEVWDAGNDGFNTHTVPSCREARAKLIAAIDALASLPEAPQANATAEPDKFAVQHAMIVKFAPMVKAVIDLLAAVDEKHEKESVPLKFTIPYGAVNALRASVGMVPDVASVATAERSMADDYAPCSFDACPCDVPCLRGECKHPAGASLPAPLTDARIDALDTFALHAMAPLGRQSVRDFARAVLAAQAASTRAGE